MWRRERWFLFIGIIFGAIPGMNGNLAITVLLPFGEMRANLPL
jgi:putative tricarboxylic transport membrane protein